MGNEMKIQCYLFGHEPEEHTDSGYPICKRCGAHGYYDIEQWENSAHIRFFLYKTRQYLNVLWQKIIGKYEKDELPF